MYLNKAKFITSMSKFDGSKIEGHKQIAVVGKSNVGKSSFINCVTNNKKLCKVGQTPGKTRLINWFLVEDNMYLVDLPGYGYAKRSRQEIVDWGNMIEGYFSETENLEAIVLLIDIRHSPTKDDVSMFEWINYYNIKPIIVCTKAEKIAKTKRKQRCKEIAKELDFDGTILPIDSTTNYGRDEIVELIKSLI